MKSVASLFLLIAALGWTLTACTATHTEAQLRSGELQRDAKDRADEERDREIGEEGGIGSEEIRGDEGWVVEQSDL